jgi:ABC-type transport system involved in cytochrome bd biosynthesis fused ATPase/permease subunit
MPNKTKRPTSITLSISIDDATAIENLRLSAPWASPHAIMRVAARVGLAALAEEPSRLVGLLTAQGVRIGGTK